MIRQARAVSPNVARLLSNSPQNGARRLLTLLHGGRPRALCGLASFIAVAALLPAQRPKSEEPAPPGNVIRTETQLVVVDAVVMDKKGNLVRDLTAKDFKIQEDKRDQAIKSFALETAQSPNAQKRYLMLFFDDTSLEVGDQIRARQAATKFIAGNTTPNQAIAVGNFSGVMSVVQNFTEDRDKVNKAIATLGASGGSRTNASSPPPSSGGRGGQLTGPTGSGNYSSARQLVQGLRDWAKNLASIPGRKALIVFSGGFAVNADLEREISLTADACNRANVAIYAIDVRDIGSSLFKAAVSPANGYRVSAANGSMMTSPADSASAMSLRALRNSPILMALRMSLTDLAFQTKGGTAGGGGTTGGTGGTAGSSSAGGAMGPSTGASGRGGNNNPFGNNSTQPGFGSSSADSGAANQQGLERLAESTGGYSVRNTQDPLEAMNKIANEVDEHYVIGYTPPDSEEGSCHSIRVRVDKGGLKVRSRSEYCKVRPKDPLSGKPAEKVLESRAAGTSAGNMPASFQSPFFYTQANTARVNIAMEIASEPVKFEKIKDKNHAAIDILGLAYLPDGSVGARFSDTLNFDFDEKDKLAVERFKSRPIHYQTEFQASPGKYNLKVVFSSGGDSFGKLEGPLEIEPFDGKDLTLSALTLSREARPAGDVVDMSLLSDVTPLVAEGMRIVPTGSNRFKKTENSFFYVEIYEPRLAEKKPDFAIVLQLVLKDRKSGEKKGDSGQMRLDTSKLVNTTTIPLAQRLPVTNLAPGSYTLEFSVMDTANKTFKRTVDFEVE